MLKTCANCWFKVSTTLHGAVDIDAQLHAMILLVTAGASSEQPKASAGHPVASHQTHREVTSTDGTEHGALR